MECGVSALLIILSIGNALRRDRAESRARDTSAAQTVQALALSDTPHLRQMPHARKLSQFDLCATHQPI
jgi:hypothetical protein